MWANRDFSNFLSFLKELTSLGTFWQLPYVPAKLKKLKKAQKTYFREKCSWFQIHCLSWMAWKLRIKVPVPKSSYYFSAQTLRPSPHCTLDSLNSLMWLKASVNFFVPFFLWFLSSLLPQSLCLCDSSALKSSWHFFNWLTFTHCSSPSWDVIQCQKPFLTPSCRPA